MADLETLSERVSALERTVTDGEIPSRRDDADLRKTTANLAERMDELEAELDELDAAVQALRGYVGNIRAVNDDVERRADAALAKAEAAETSRPDRSNMTSRPPSNGGESSGNRNPDRLRSETPPEKGTPPSPTSPYELPRCDPERDESDDRSLTTRLRHLL
ncbi:hypothetical protein [Haladaptatus sp. DYF46]|uniref:DUF7310 family coiled-coil domain-containing protein n=1 Tax=Haladaptatus sp. DYF46 TaxID=2886041 RepID=UPI001E345942|nr:hypothetical protein [Haladaptatus sp. DYF46]